VSAGERSRSAAAAAAAPSAPPSQPGPTPSRPTSGRGTAGLRALHADGLVGVFHEAGVLALADVHVARRLGRLGHERDPSVLLACALAVRAVRAGSSCVDLAAVASSVPDDRDGRDDPDGRADPNDPNDHDGRADPEDPADHDGRADPDGRNGADPPSLPWPAPADWLAACAGSPLVAGEHGDWAPLRLVDGLLYLDRYFQQEQQVRASLDDRADRSPPVVDVAALRASLDRLFPGSQPDRQRLAVAVAATRWVTVLAGGPGTGKTTTVARLLVALQGQPGPPPRIALAAPTGKAAARLQEAVQGAGLGLELRAATLHRLLGWRPDSRSRFRHDSRHHLPFDVVVVDETSMVSLTLMSRLLEAVRPDARLVLVGDPDQLASVEAGAVLGDLVARPLRQPTGSAARAGGSADPTAPDGPVGAARRVLEALVPGDLAPVGLPPPTPTAGPPPADPGAGAHRTDQRDSPRSGSGPDELDRGVVRLSWSWRYGGAIADLAAAVRDGEADRAVDLLRIGGAVSLVGEGSVADLRAAVLAAARPLVAAARAGDAVGALDALDAHRLLCAHRHGPFGVGHWAGLVAGWLVQAGLREDGEWAVGRAVLVTGNDHELQLYNGDTGVLVAGDGGPVAVFPRAGGPMVLAPSRLPVVQSVDALTVHRSQGSQFTEVTVVLPPPESPLLTRELLYTAVSRAREHVRLIGTEEAVRAAVTRPVVRASGLRRPST